MLNLFFTIGLLITFAVMLPGPDVALVMKNTLLYSRRAGIFTSLGVASANLIHITYCILGLAVVISQSLLLFSIIKYIGAGYLIYMGITALMARHDELAATKTHHELRKSSMSAYIAFRQGFLCNLLNPKATLFFLALFTAIIKPETPILWEIAFAVEMLIIIVTWFCCLTLMLSHPRVVRLLNRMEKYIEKTLGVFLIGFGVALAFVKK
jgi:RhtB (resistance to homoserine/threonine) family protein